MQIAPATLAEAPDVARIHVRAWQAAYAGLVPAEHLASLSMDKREAMWRKSIAEGRPQLLVARRDADDPVAGWIAFADSRDGDAAPTTAEVWALYADPAHWSTGVGRALWLAARERLKQQGRTRVTLWALAGNRRAIGFYRAAGFEPEPASAKDVAIGGQPLRELRYATNLN